MNHTIAGNARVPQTLPTRTTSEAVLAAARRLFAARGYDGTSVRAITAEAGTNLGAVTYHFGSKRKLYEQVLERVLAPIPGRVAAAIADGRTPLDRLEGVVRAFFDQLREHPDQPLLILQEIAAGKPMPAPLRRVILGVRASVIAVILDGQSDGSIRAGDPMLFMLSLISQPVYLSLVAGALPPEAGVRLDRPEGHEAAVEHAVRFVRAGLAGSADSMEGTS